MFKSEITIRLTLTLSKIMGSIIIFTGIFGFLNGIGLSESITLIIIGAGMIGYKQHLISKEKLSDKT